MIGLTYEQKLAKHREEEAEIAAKFKKIAASRAIKKAKLLKKAEVYFKKNPRKKEVPSIILNTKKAGFTLSGWLRATPISELTEADIENEVEFGFNL